MIREAVFLGSKKIGLAIFKSLYEVDQGVNWTILCVPDIDDKRSCYEAFQAFAKKETIELIEASSPQKVLQYSIDHRPDIMMVSGYYRILPEELFEHVRDGLWGFHHSLLPEYRGGSPLVWQMINNEKTLGSSLFQFRKGVDDGPVLHQVSIENSVKMTITEAMNEIESEWLKKIPEIWKSFVNGNFSPSEQDHTKATYCAQRQDFDGRIDWSWMASSIDCFIRAQAHPYPRAFFDLDGNIIRVVKHEVDNRTVYGVPGQVYEVGKGFVTICCGNGTAIRLCKLEVDNKEIVASEVIKSFKLRL